IPVFYIVTLLFALSAFSQTPTPTYSSDGSEKPAAVQSSPTPAANALAEEAKKEIKVSLNPAYVRKDAPARITRFETPPVIDGQLNDAVWKNATVFGDFLQIRP